MLYIQFSAPDDGRRNRLKHAEHFTEINELCDVASCWLYLNIPDFFLKKFETHSIIHFSIIDLKMGNVNIITFDIHMSIHRNTIPNYNEQDATFLALSISIDALHVSRGSSAHHQEHITVHTASSIAIQYCCLLLSWMRWNCVPSHRR